MELQGEIELQGEMELQGEIELCRGTGITISVPSCGGIGDFIGLPKVAEHQQ